MYTGNRIRYRKFWPQFNKKDNFISRTLANVQPDMEIEVWSVFESTPMRILLAMASKVAPKLLNPGRGRSKKQRKVWYSGENVRPPISEEFDAFISYDQDPMGGANFYFPLFYVDLLIGHPEASSRQGIAHVDASTLTAPRQPSLVKSKGVCAFISNPEPTRLRAITELRKWIDVDVFGPFVGKHVDSKYRVAKDYKYMLCFENDLFPGYVTEKLLDAYVCKTVPLYWGDLGSEPHINRSSFVNAAGFESLEKFAKYVGNISDDEYGALYQEPLLSSLPRLETLMHALTGVKA
jgi:hypothetical protein